MHMRSNAFRLYLIGFNSSCVIAQMAAYLGNGTGDRSQTSSKISSNEVLLLNLAIAIFHKNPMHSVFPDLVTYDFHKVMTIGNKSGCKTIVPYG